MTTLPLITQLTLENRKLRDELLAARQWIGREITDRKMVNMRTATLGKTRHHLEESEEEITTRINKYLKNKDLILPPGDTELLIESEINFSHLIRKKNLDGIMVASAYQKVLENFFEEHIVAKFREKYKNTRLHPEKNNILEKTLYKVIHDDFRLSLGKVYQILLSMIKGGGGLIKAFQEATADGPLSHLIDIPEFWELFTDIISTQAFGGKRHTGKITLVETRILREKITGNYEHPGLLMILLQSIQ